MNSLNSNFSFKELGIKIQINIFQFQQYIFKNNLPANGYIFIDSPLIRRQNSMRKVHWNYINFERRIHEEIMTSIQSGNFYMDSTLKLTKYWWVLQVDSSMSFRRRIGITSVPAVSIVSFPNILCSGEAILV